MGSGKQDGYEFCSVAYRKVLAVEPERVLAQEAPGWEMWSIIYAHTHTVGHHRERELKI